MTSIYSHLPAEDQRIIMMREGRLANPALPEPSGVLALINTVYRSGRHRSYIVEGARVFDACVKLARNSTVNYIEAVGGGWKSAWKWNRRKNDPPIITVPDINLRKG